MNPLEQGNLTRALYRVRPSALSKTMRGNPFFLFLSHSAPHIPLVASPAFAGTSRAGAYGDVVQELDWSVGEVLDAVQRNDLADDTVIIFTSDKRSFSRKAAPAVCAAAKARPGTAVIASRSLHAGRDGSAPAARQAQWP